MNRLIGLISIFAAAFILNACEGCTKMAAKKATGIGLSALEGITEAISERGDTIAGKVADAAGNIAQGAGRSISRQLDTHAEDVATAAGRTLVQTVTGLEEGMENELFDDLPYQEELPGGVALHLFAKARTRPIITAEFIILESGTYSVKFEFCTDDCETVAMTKEAEMQVASNDSSKHTRVSFSFNQNELTALAGMECTRITVMRKD